jgi:hypothetical protein
MTRFSKKNYRVVRSPGLLLEKKAFVKPKVDAGGLTDLSQTPIPEAQWRRLPEQFQEMMNLSEFPRKPVSVVRVLILKKIWCCSRRLAKVRRLSPVSEPGEPTAEDIRPRIFPAGIQTDRKLERLNLVITDVRQVL